MGTSAGYRSAQWRAAHGRGSEKSGKTPDGSDSGPVSLASRRPLHCQKRLQALDVQRQTHQVPFPSRLVQAPHAESPESKDFLEPAIGRFGQPFALRVMRPPPLASPASRPCDASPGVCARPGSPSSCPRAPAPHTRRYPALQAPTSPAHCSTRRRQAPFRAARRRSPPPSSSSPTIAPWSLAFEVNSVATIN